MMKMFLKFGIKGCSESSRRRKVIIRIVTIVPTS